MLIGRRESQRTNARSLLTRVSFFRLYYILIAAAAALYFKRIDQLGAVTSEPSCPALICVLFFFAFPYFNTPPSFSGVSARLFSVRSGRAVNGFTTIPRVNMVYERAGERVSEGSRRVRLCELPILPSDSPLTSAQIVCTQLQRTFVFCFFFKARLSMHPLK